MVDVVIPGVRKGLTAAQRRIELKWNAYWNSKYAGAHCERAIDELRKILPHLRDPRTRFQVKRALAAVRRVRDARYRYLRRVGPKGIAIPTSFASQEPLRPIVQGLSKGTVDSRGAMTSESQAANQRLK